MGDFATSFGVIMFLCIVLGIVVATARHMVAKSNRAKRNWANENDFWG